MIRTRFAPSPTGFIHLGALRTALYTYCLAKQDAQGVFVLRIEDTDTARFVDGATDAIYNALRKCELVWDEGPDIGGGYAPYIQSERKSLYADYARQLVDSGHAYYCECDKSGNTDTVRKPSDKCPCRDKKLTSGVIRQRIPLDGETSYQDEVYGTVTFPNTELDDQILLKTDGMPTYNFANVVDDHLMGITHVVRGNEYLSSTPKYNLLYKAFGWQPPKYIHVEQIMRDARHKLSKRDGDAYFEDFLSKGFIVPAIINYIALLGWSPRGDIAEQEIFSLAELVQYFDVGGLSKSPAIFDIDKLRALNGKWIRTLPADEFERLASDFSDNLRALKGKLNNYPLLIELLQKRTETLTDIENNIDFLLNLEKFDNSLYNNKKSKSTHEIALELLTGVLPLLETITDWTAANLFDTLSAYCSQNSINKNTLFHALRTALSGKAVTPGGATDLMDILGKQETINRTALAK
ncbi:MAG: glutamate--tRNA ligase [Oscillospiraceae bacterium]|jgi:glutamyl-tRNA synthetase|nr:glutamate--tRNA ligase [Oscillospiraceae bacterium]